MAHSHPAGEGMYYGAGGGSEAAWQAGLRAAEGPPTPPRARRVSVEVTRHEVVRSPVKAYSAEATPEPAFEPQPLQREVRPRLPALYSARAPEAPPLPRLPPPARDPPLPPAPRVRTGEGSTGD